ncbi:hypothetical protein, partial [Enterococcus plantarum]|uniref:hypothetical protein n=1 Tax=Enterococcus plantarum TaxID=1077675 RepID=UPI001C64B5CF
NAVSHDTQGLKGACTYFHTFRMLCGITLKKWRQPKPSRTATSDNIWLQVSLMPFSSKHVYFLLNFALVAIFSLINNLIKKGMIQ